MYDLYTIHNIQYTVYCIHTYMYYVCAKILSVYETLFSTCCRYNAMYNNDIKSYEV